MPCYLFTFHAYATWLPDRKQGYVHRTRGLQSQDYDLSDRYTFLQKEPSVEFTPAIQQRIMTRLHEAAKYQHLRLHAVAMDLSHIHILASWHDSSRTANKVSAALKSSITRSLNTLKRRKWLSAKGSRKQVKDERHYNYLIEKYLQSHRGMKYNERHDKHQ